MFVFEDLRGNYEAVPVEFSNKHNLVVFRNLLSQSTKLNKMHIQDVHVVQLSVIAEYDY